MKADEAVKLRHEAVLPIVGGVEVERQPALLQHAVNSHVAIVVDRHVTHARHGEADHAGMIAELVDHPLAGIGIAEWQEAVRLQPRVAWQHLLRHEARVGKREVYLDVRARMRADVQQRIRKQDHAVDAERVHGAAQRHDIGVHGLVVDLVAWGEVRMNDAAASALRELVAVGMQQHRPEAGVRCALEAIGLGLQDRVFDVIDDLVPRAGLEVMRVEVDDEVIVELSSIAVLGCVPQRLASV